MRPGPIRAKSPRLGARGAGERRFRADRLMGEFQEKKGRRRSPMDSWHTRNCGHKGGRTPSIALTAFARSEDLPHAMPAGSPGHIATPSDPPELATTAASLVGRTGERR